MRGEKNNFVHIPGVHLGSSPHARGKDLSDVYKAIHVRIIPACAGKRLWYQTRKSRNQDHPRMRGEKGLFPLLYPQHQGSSPHARGKVLYLQGIGNLLRIIPACAGKRLNPDAPSIDWNDHPRMRGEKTFVKVLNSVKRGSSPHARGKVTSSLHPSNPYRIIPACAGKRPTTGRPTTARQDHPRMRGEKFPHPYLLQKVPGSSPHARGKVFS